MSNPSNFGIVTGRLAADPTLFTNSDGSRTVKMRVFANNNFKNRDGSRGSVSVPVEAFIPKDRGNGVYEHLGKGDLVTVAYAAANSTWKDANGVTQYRDYNQITEVTMLESIETTQARRQANAQKAQAAQAAQAAPAPAQPQAPVAQAAPAQAPVYQQAAPVQAQAPMQQIQNWA